MDSLVLRLTATVKCKGMIGDLDIQDLFDRILDLLYTRITELQHLAGIQTYEMIVLAGTETLLELGTVVSKLMFDNQAAGEQKLDSIVKRCPADPVLIVLHPDIETLYVKMPVGAVDLLEDGEPFRGLSMPVGFQILGQNLSYSLKGVVVVFLHLTQVLFRA